MDGNYLSSQELSLPDYTVRWRKHLHELFKEARRLAGAHGKERASRLLDAIPPPNDPEILDKSRELMAEVLDKRTRPRDAARILTQEIVRVQRGELVSWNYVCQGADDKARRGAVDDPHFSWAIEYMANEIAAGKGKAKRQKANFCPVSPENSDKTDAPGGE